MPSTLGGKGHDIYIFNTVMLIHFGNQQCFNCICVLGHQGNATVQKQGVTLGICIPIRSNVQAIIA